MGFHPQAPLTCDRSPPHVYCTLPMDGVGRSSDRLLVQPLSIHVNSVFTLIKVPSAPPRVLGRHSCPNCVPSSGVPHERRDPRALAGELQHVVLVPLPLRLFHARCFLAPCSNCSAPVSGARIRTSERTKLRLAPRAQERVFMNARCDFCL